MRLRSSIRTPTRYDEEYDENYHDLTKPAYPELLASQTVSFNPDHPPAAFPSLALAGKEDHGPHVTSETDDQREHNTRDSLLTPNCCEMQTDKPEGVIFLKQAMSKEGKTTHSNSENPLKLVKEPRRKRMRTGHHKSKGRSVRICWCSLDFAVQYWIFINTSKFFSHEVVMDSLDITRSEMIAIQEDVELRKLYPMSADDLWRYACNAANQSQTYIEPPILQQFSDYMVFARRYETALETQLQQGYRYLEQCDLDPILLGTWISESEESPYMTILPIENDYSTMLDMLHADRDDIETEMIHPESIATSASFDEVIDLTGSEARAQLSLNSYRNTIARQHHHQTIVLNSHLSSDVGKDSGFPQPVGFHSDPENRNGSFVTFKFDNKVAFASIVQRNIRSSLKVSTTLWDRNLCLSTSISSGRTEINAPYKALRDCNNQRENESVIHPNHKAKFFSRIFTHRQFPAKVRNGLMKGNPSSFNTTKLWLVYGELLFHDGFPSFGQNRETSKTLLLPSTAVLRQLVYNRNIWYTAILEWKESSQPPHLLSAPYLSVLWDSLDRTIDLWADLYERCKTLKTKMITISDPVAKTDMKSQINEAITSATNCFHQNLQEMFIRYGQVVHVPCLVNTIDIVGGMRKWAVEEREIIPNEVQLQTATAQVRTRQQPDNDSLEEPPAKKPRQSCQVVSKHFGSRNSNDPSEEDNHNQS